MRNAAYQNRMQDAIIARHAQEILNAKEWLRRAYVEEAKLVQHGLTLRERIEVVARIDALRDRALEELRLIPQHVRAVHGFREKRAA
jgi:hypothetical protein